MTDPARTLSRAERNARALSTEHLSESIGSRTLRGGAIAIGAQVVRLVMQLGSTFVLARLLMPDDFGLVVLGWTTLNLITLFTDMGIGHAAIQRQNLDQDTASGLFLIALGGGVLAALFACAIAPLSAMAFDEPRVTWLVIALSGQTILGCMGTIHHALLSRAMRWGDAQGITLVSQIAGVVAGVLAAWLTDLGYWSLVVQAWVSAATSTILSWLACDWRPVWPKTWGGTRSAMVFGANMMGYGVLNFVRRQMDSALIGWRWGTTELGFYSRAQTLLQTPLKFVDGPISYALMPALGRLQGEPQKWRQAYLDGLAVITLVGGGLAALLGGGAGPIIEIVMGPGWDESKLIFAALVISMIPATPMNTTELIYVSTGRTDRMFRWSVLSTPIYVGAFFVGLPFGATGLALCYGAAMWLTFWPCFKLAIRGTSLKMTDIYMTVAPPSIIAIAIGLALRLATEQLGLVMDVVAIAAAGFAYLAAIAAAVWTLPNYRRIRDKCSDILISRLARFTAASGRPTP